MLDRANINIIKTGNDEHGYLVANMYSEYNGNYFLEQGLELAYTFGKKEEILAQDNSSYQPVFPTMARIIIELVQYWNVFDITHVKTLEEAYKYCNNNEVNRPILTFDRVHNKTVLYYDYYEYTVINNEANVDNENSAHYEYSSYSCEPGIIAEFKLTEYNKILEFIDNKLPIDHDYWDVGNIVNK